MSQLLIRLRLEHFAITSDGEKVDNPRYLKRALDKLERAQQNLSRKKKGSNNHEKARLKVARAYVKVRDCRDDFLHSSRRGSSATTKRWSSRTWR